MDNERRQDRTGLVNSNAVQKVNVAEKEDTVVVMASFGTVMDGKEEI